MKTVKGNVYLSPLATPAPMKMEVSSNRDGKEWRLIGYINDLEIKDEPTYEEIKFSSLDSHLFKTDQKVTIKAQFVPGPDSNFYHILGVPVEKSVEKLRRLLNGKRK